MAELRVRIGTITTLIGLAIGLQAEQTDLTTTGHKLSRQLSQALAGPAQW
jgi:hypothetical protein